MAKPSRRTFLAGLATAGPLLGGCLRRRTRRTTATATETRTETRTRGPSTTERPTTTEQPTTATPEELPPTAASPEIRWRKRTIGPVMHEPVLTDGTLYVGSNELFALFPENGIERWVFREEALVDSSPLVTDERIYVASGPMQPRQGGYSVYAVDRANGEKQWRFQRTRFERDGRIDLLGVAEGVVLCEWFTHTGYGYTYGVDATSGEMRWRTQPGSFRTRGTVIDGTVYLSDSETLRALDPKTGEMRRVREGFVADRPVEHNSLLYADVESEIVAVNPHDGKTVWSFDAEGESVTSWHLAGETMYVAAIDGTLSALSAATGDEQWTASVEPPVRGLDATGDAAFAANKAGRVYAFAAKNGTKRWVTGPLHGTTSAVETGDSVYLSLHDPSALVKFDQDEGTRRWRTEPGAHLTRPVVENGIVYVGTEAGRIYALA